MALANKMYVTAVVQDDTSDSSSSLIEVLKDTASQLVSNTLNVLPF